MVNKSFHTKDARSHEHQKPHIWYKLGSHFTLQNDGDPRTTVIQTVPWTK